MAYEKWMTGTERDKRWNKQYFDKNKIKQRHAASLKNAVNSLVA
jgi:hypothetical protein